MYAVKRNLKNPTLSHFTLPYYPADWRRMNKRRIWQAESSDLLHWTEPYPVLTPEDGEDGLDETYYGMHSFNGNPSQIFFEKVRKKTGAIAVEVIHNGEWMIKMQLSLLSRSRLIGFSNESVY